MRNRKDIQSGIRKIGVPRNVRGIGKVARTSGRTAGRGNVVSRAQVGCTTSGLSNGVWLTMEIWRDH